MSWVEFDRIISEFASSCHDGFDCILGITRGGLIPAVALSHTLGVEDLKTILIKRNASDRIYSGKIVPMVEDFDFRHLSGKKVLVVDDIAGTGETLGLMHASLTSHGIEHKLFALVKFVGSYSPPQDLDFTYGVESDRWVVFPWE